MFLKECFNIIKRTFNKNSNEREKLVLTNIFKYINNKTEIDKSYAIENIVYNELIIKGYDVYTGKTKKGEIDFVATKPDKKIYIQVAFSIPNEETKKREFGAYEVINDNYAKYIITLDKLTYEYNGIKHINLIDFLLDKDF